MCEAFRVARSIDGTAHISLVPRTRAPHGRAPTTCSASAKDSRTNTSVTPRIRDSGGMLSLVVTAVATVHFFTCRHGYEQPLAAELERNGARHVNTPCQAVVSAEFDTVEVLPDPAYALQILPSAVEISGMSVKSLASNAAAALGVANGATSFDDETSNELLNSACRGALTVHALVPDLLRGTPPQKCRLLRRCSAVADALTGSLRRRYAAARPPRGPEGSPSDGKRDGQVLLQLLLLTPEQLMLSVALVQEHSSQLGFWPSPIPAGLVDTTLPGYMPSSAYRKLGEALVCGFADGLPSPYSQCVDLGACPGGWTAYLRRVHDCRVVAVDRQPVAAALMADPMVTFESGDAFIYEPQDAPVEWLVSDVIAFPERVSELLERWCGGRWAQNMVVTMKFRGAEPDWGALEAAVQIAASHGFKCRVKHFFSNKNEVTLMLRSAIS